MRLSRPVRIAGFAAGGVLLLLATISLGYFPSAADSARVVPPPAIDAAQYDKVTSGRTGHAEAVRISYDPRRISLGRVLQIYFSVVHDPTELNRQGPDVGTHYRSAIFPANDEQARVARAYVDQLNQARTFSGKVVTTIEPTRDFYPAEAYHQDYMTLNPKQPYIAFHDLPKVANLKRLFPGVYRAEPALVSKTGM
jgi:peptide-methionine (S)-S-oxide reductase